MKALEKSPDARYQSMEDFGAALADPVAFVEANGGLQGFHSANMGAPAMPPSSQSGPAYPRQITSAGDQTGPVHVAGTQYPSGIHQPAQKSKTPIFIGLGVVAAAGIAAAVVLGGGEEKQVAEAEPAPAPLAAPVEPEVKPEPPEPVEPEVKPTEQEPKAAAAVPVKLKLTTKPKSADIFINDEPNGTTNSGQWLEYDSDDLPMTIVLRRKGYEDKEVVWNFSEDQSKQRYTIKETLVKETRARRNEREAREIAEASSTKPVTTSTKPVKQPTGGGLLMPSIDDAPKPKPKPKKTGNNLVAPDL